ncbi:helix-turn-helix transcriptional regulator [Novosphingobium flavum]|uniref:helix-turn-helix transcriptional regulator n=1 Tax=Novosphingobium aerophilum TaxID=2839843 RepID=UPI001639B3D4|nr:helix-turn-helix transcriptional regulator [Novosphingobium aerophilum]MBC2661150.1 helix-turn-helix transcriptional regulator [Novosphingobium aerophilum]
MSKESKLPAAANLLLASRTVPAGSGAALITALGKHPLVARGEMPKALHPNVAIPSQLYAAERNPKSVIAEAVGTTRTPLTSIAELGMMVRDARKAMKMNQTEFAAHAGVGRRFVSELEGGKPSLEFDKVLACAAAAGVDLFAKKRRV